MTEQQRTTERLTVPLKHRTKLAEAERRGDLAIGENIRLIEHLRQLNDRLAEAKLDIKRRDFALVPFALVAEQIEMTDYYHPDHHPAQVAVKGNPACVRDDHISILDVGDFRRAAAAISKPKSGEKK